MCLLRMRQAALTMIAAARARGIPVVVAGSDASDHPATYLDGGAAVVVTGEGEVTLVEVLDVMSRAVGRAGAVDRVDGVCRADAGRPRSCAPRGARSSAISIGCRCPAWDLVDVERYRAIWRARHGYFSMNVATTRGCPYHCNWCAKPIYGQRYTARSPEHVVDEIAWLKGAYEPDHLWIADDIFGLKPGWIEQFAELVAGAGAAMPFKCLLRADRCHRDDGAGAQSRGLPDGMDRCGIGIAAHARRDGEGHARRSDPPRPPRRCARGHRGRLLPAVRLPRRDADRHSDAPGDGARVPPDDIGVSVSYPLPGTTFYNAFRRSSDRSRTGWIRAISR